MATNLVALKRFGNKTALARQIQGYFPPHELYLEPFFGAGGMFFNKPKAKKNIVNDSDSEVYNFFRVIRQTPRKLRAEIERTPLHQKLWEDWKKTAEPDPVRRAVRFVFRSNFGFMGKPDTPRFGSHGIRQLLLDRLDPTLKFLADVEFTHCDFRKFLGKISLSEADQRRAFIYADPPYLGTSNNYKAGFVEQDFVDLLNCLQKSGIRFAVSEFNSPAVLREAKKHKLRVITLGERQNLGNRRTEVLLLNYDPPKITTHRKSKSFK